MRKILCIAVLLAAPSLFSQTPGGEIPGDNGTVTASVTPVTPYQQKLKNVSIYPNPVQSQFRVDFPSSIPDIKVEVYNILGKKVITQILTPENRTVNAATLSKGVYMVRITSEKGVKIFKIVKQ